MGLGLVNTGIMFITVEVDLGSRDGSNPGYSEIHQMAKMAKSDLGLISTGPI